MTTVAALAHDDRPLTLGEARALYLAMGDLQHEVHALRGDIRDLAIAMRQVVTELRLLAR